MPESILYYPFINVSDGTWLRNAALYWDEVCSIVPYRGYPDRSPELRYMEERGQYRPIYPQELFYAHNADELCSQLQKGLRQRGNSASHSSGLQLPPRERKRIYSPGLAELIHYKKLPRNLLNTLVASGIVTPIDGEWLEADEAFEHIYMRLLAGFAAKHDQANMVIGTDKARELNSIYHAYPHTGRNGINSSVVLTLDHCFPAPAEDIGLERILDFKEEYHSELLELRRKIREYESNVSSCASIEDVKRTTAAFRESWEIELTDAEQMFRGGGIGFTLQTLRTFVVDAGAAAGLLQGIQALGLASLNSAVLGATVGMSGLIGVGIQHRNYRNKINERNHNNGFAYIIKAYQSGLIRPNQVAEVL